jgi:hypothetical protein
MKFKQEEETKKEEAFLGYMDDEEQIGTRFGNTEREKKRVHLGSISKRRGSFDAATASTGMFKGVNTRAPEADLIPLNTINPKRKDMLQKQ